MNQLTGKITTVISDKYVDSEKYVFDSIRKNVKRNYGKKYIPAARIIYFGREEDFKTHYGFNNVSELLMGYFDDELLPMYIDNFMNCVYCVTSVKTTEPIYIIINTSILSNPKYSTEIQAMSSRSYFYKMIDKLKTLLMCASKDVSIFIISNIDESKYNNDNITYIPSIIDHYSPKLVHCSDYMILLETVDKNKLKILLSKPLCIESEIYLEKVINAKKISRFGIDKLLYLASTNSETGE